MGYRFLITLIVIYMLTVKADDQLFTMPITNNGKWEIKANLNKYIVIKIRGNPTTGYAWMIENVDHIDRNLIAPLNLNKYNSTNEFITDPHEEGMTGVGGYYLFKFKPLMLGTVNLNFIYKRAWEDNYSYKVETTINIIDEKSEI